MSEPSTSGGSHGAIDPRRARARMREVFASPGFRSLFAVRSVSQFGDGVFQVSAASVLLFQNPGRNPAAGLFVLTAATLIPFSVVGPFVGVFIDRWDRRSILTRVPLARAAVAALLPIAALSGTHSPAFYIDTLIVLSANRFFLATMSAVLPQLVPEEDLLIANSVTTTGGSIANVVGLGIGSVLSAGIGGENTAVISAVAFALAALASRFIPVHRAHDAVAGSMREDLRAVMSDLRVAARSMTASPRVRYGMTAIALMQFIVGAMVGILTYFIIHVLGLEVGASAGLLTALAVGIGFGVVLVPVIGRRIAHDALVPLGFAIGMSGAIVGAVYLSRSILLVAAWFMGTSYAFAKIPIDTIVQEEMADVVRGRAFAVYDMLFNFARVTGVGVIALAYARGASSRTLIAGLGVVFGAGAVLFSSWERGVPMWRKRKRDRSPSLQAGEMVTVRAYAGARADEEPRAIVTGGVEIPIDQIDWRSVVEESGQRARVFVVRAGGQRIRLAHREDAGWQVDRVMSEPIVPGGTT